MNIFASLSGFRGLTILSASLLRPDLSKNFQAVLLNNGE